MHISGDRGRLFEFSQRNVGDGPIGHAAVLPVQHVVSATRGCGGGRIGSRRRPREEVDHVLSPPKHQGRRDATREIVQAAAGERISFRGQVLHLWREVQLAGEPGFTVWRSVDSTSSR